LATEPLPVVRVCDDGELDDVRSLLDQLGVDWVRDDEERERPTALWIGNPRRLIAAAEAGEAIPAFRIAIADKLTKALQGQLERFDPEFVVSRPVHPSALRLLILHALYVGPERRGSERVALSAAIRFKTGVFGRPAQLVEISRGGCRIVASGVPAAGESITVVLPRELTHDAVLHLTGRVVAVDPAGGWEPGEQACSVAFEDLTPDMRRALRALMANQPGAAALQPHAAPGERRRSTRLSYEREVLASRSGAARILIGRDLSSGGMRVAPDADLGIGDEFKLVVYGPAASAPLLLRARVARDDGDAGCVLTFRDVPPETAAELDRWTEQLPNLVSERVDDDAEAPSEG
jgi:hypothetical protein